jgi:hypothetical protein
MLKRNRSDARLDVYSPPSDVECLVLLHSPFIINMTDMKKIVNKTDAHTDEINAYCSSFVFVTGCSYQMTSNCFNWIHSFDIHGWYKNFKDLKNVLIYLSLTAVSNSEIHRFVIDSSNSIVFNTWVHIGMCQLMMNLSHQNQYFS